MEGQRYFLAATQAFPRVQARALVSCLPLAPSMYTLQVGVALRATETKDYANRGNGTAADGTTLVHAP